MRRSWVFATSVAAILAVARASVADRFNINIGVEDNGDVDITVEVPTECPKIDPKNTTVHLPHETDCTKFYRCERGKRIILECHVSEVNGTRMHYDRIQQVCDWPERAGCSIGDNTTRQAITTEITTTRLPTALPIGSTTKVVSRKPNTGKITTITMESSTRGNGVPTKCPKADSMDTTVRLPHETDCTKFYICDHGKPILFECPLMDAEGNRLHFNPVLQVCDWPNHAGCISKGTTTTEGEVSSEATPMMTVPTAEVDQNSTPTPADTYVPHENNCSRFYEIVNNEKILKECPRGLHFSPTEKHCDWPDKAGCALTTLTFAETTPNPEPEGSCGNIGNNWVVAHECACNKYYTCSNGELILKECQEGLHFGPSYFGCVKPELAGCESTTIGIITDIDTTTKLIPTDCPPDNSGQPVRLPHETNCSLFYECDNGKKILHQCQDDFHFNARLQMCEWSDSAGCVTRPTDIKSSQGTTKPTKPEDGTSTSVPTDCSLDSTGKSVQLPHPYNCSLYYSCANGNKVVQVCPDRLEFNPKKQVCDWPEIAGCVTLITKEPWTTWIWSTSSSISQDRSTETRKNSTAKLTTLLTSSTEKLTTPPSSTTEKWIKTTTPEGGTSVPMSNECPSDNLGYAVQLPHPYNCSLFYKCDDGNKVVQSCPDGLEFNAREQICDWPIIAACVGSTTKEPWTKWIWSTTSSTSQYRSTETSKTSEDLKNLSSSTVEKLTLPSRSTEELTTLPRSITETWTLPPKSTTEKLITTGISFIIPICESGSKLPHENNCSLYYECEEGTKKLKECPPGLHFNPLLNICDWPANAGCARTTIQSTHSTTDRPTPPKPITTEQSRASASTTTEQPSPSKAITTEQSSLPSSTTTKQLSPSKPVTTKQPGPPMTITTEQPSPPTTTMSEQPRPPMTITSEQPSTPKPMTTEKPSPPKPVTTEQSSPLSSTTTEQPSPSKTTTTEQSSPTKPITTEQPSTSKRVTTEQPSPPKPITTEQPSTAKLVTTEQPSSLTTIMSQQSSTPKPITTEEPTTDYEWVIPDTCIGTCPLGDPMNAILLPNVDCTKFCICSNGRGYIYDCPSNLHFSPSKRVCDYPRRAKCVGKGGSGHAKV